MKKTDCLFFKARAKPDAKPFSNLFSVNVTIIWPMDCPAVFLRGLTCMYPSTENMYQALKALDLGTAREFECGGLFASFDIFEKWPCPKMVAAMKAREKKSPGNKKLPEVIKMVDMKASKLKEWKDCVGIVAKMVAGLPTALLMKLWGVRLVNVPLAISVWPAILCAKFKPGSQLALALIKTQPKHLVELDIKTYPAPKASFYGGKWSDQDNKLIGENRMGILLMKCRSNLLIQ